MAYNPNVLKLFGETFYVKDGELFGVLDGTLYKLSKEAYQLLLSTARTVYDMKSTGEITTEGIPPEVAKWFADGDEPPPWV